MTERFIVEDYEQILYNMYLDYHQGVRIVTEYTTKLLRLSERNELKYTEHQKVARYIGVPKDSLQDKMDLQTIWIAAKASSLAPKTEMGDLNVSKHSMGLHL